MKSPTESRSKVGFLLSLTLPMGFAGCGAEAGGTAFSDIALPTFSTDRVALEAPVEARRVLSDDGDMDLDIIRLDVAPNGRYISDIRWDPGNLGIRDLVTGESSRITDSSLDGAFPDGTTFSPDGSRIAYSWRLPPDEVTPQSHLELRSIGVDGTDMKVHLRSVESGDAGLYYEPEDWSRDGRYILIYMQPLDVDELATVDVETNEVRILTSGNRPFATNSFFSPDGRFVAFDQPKDRSRDSDIFLVSTGGGHVTALLETQDNEELLGWLPDGSGILFHRIAKDSRAIWKLPVRDGQASGPPQLVKNDVFDMTGIGFSDDAYFYSVTVSRPEVHMASFDLETGRVLQALVPITDPPGLFSHLATWSPDGTRFAHISTERWRNEERASRIIVRSVTGEILQDLPLEPARTRNMRWTAHGLVATDRNGFHLISLETGEETYLRGPRASGWAQPFTVSEDGSSFFVVDPSGPVTEYEIATRRERVLVEADGHAQVAFPDPPGGRILGGTVSPDGTRIAYVVSRDAPDTSGQDGGWAIEIFSPSSGETRVMGRFAGATVPTWSRDGRYLILNVRDGNAHLVRMSVEDGSMIRLAEDPQIHVGPQVSPDGRHILTRTGEHRQEVWRLTFNSGG